MKASVKHGVFVLSTKCHSAFDIKCIRFLKIEHGNTANKFYWNAEMGRFLDCDKMYLYIF